MSVFLNLIYKFKAIPIKLPIGFNMELSLKFMIS